MTATSERFVRTRAGGDIHVVVRGEGQPIVWVAGLGDDHMSFDGQLDNFVDDYTCVTFDNRGIGQSTVLPGPYTTGDFAEDAHDVVAALGIAPVCAIGSSMGGAISQSWALRHPADISRLVLSNTWAEHDPLLDLLVRHWIALAESGADQRLAESLLMGCYSGEYFRTHPGVIGEFLAMPLPDMDGLIASMAAVRDHDELERLGDIDVPTLVIAGRQDTVVRREMSARMAERLPHVRAVEIDSGHMIMWERPEEFAAAIREFLSENAG